MKYIEAINNFDCSDTVSILVETEEGQKSMSEHNFYGGVCDCCEGFDNDDNLEVIRVVDLQTMEIFYDKEQNK